MTISVLCESPQDRHLQEKCASKCSFDSLRAMFLSAFIYFLAQGIVNLKSRVTSFEVCDSCAHVWPSSKGT
jgi:hypothetical protein